jgi:hypothetical protein
MCDKTQPELAETEKEQLVLKTMKPGIIIRFRYSLIQFLLSPHLWCCLLCVSSMTITETAHMLFSSTWQVLYPWVWVTYPLLLAF